MVISARRLSPLYPADRRRRTLAGRRPRELRAFVFRLCPRRERLARPPLFLPRTSALLPATPSGFLNLRLPLRKGRCSRRLHHLTRRRGRTALSAVPRTKGRSRRFGFPSRLRSRGRVSCGPLASAWWCSFWSRFSRSILLSLKLCSCSWFASWRFAFASFSSSHSVDGGACFERIRLFLTPRLTSLYDLFPDQQTPHCTASRSSLAAQS